MNQNWYAVYTRPRWEKKVAQVLTNRRIENYCPLNKVVRKWSDRKKVVHEPLFTSYVFVRVERTELTKIREIDGIINMVYWLGKPAIIRDVEIETIKKFLSEYTSVRIEKTDVKINDTVRIISGPFMECEGNVLMLKNKTVKVNLPSLGFLMVAETGIHNVEKVEGYSFEKAETPGRKMVSL
jgi:transcription antitermination factor NusG